MYCNDFSFVSKTFSLPWTYNFFQLFAPAPARTCAIELKSAFWTAARCVRRARCPRNLASACTVGMLATSSRASPPIACALDDTARCRNNNGCPTCVSFVLLHKCASTTILKVFRVPGRRSQGSSRAADGVLTRCGGIYNCDWQAFGASQCRAKSSNPSEYADFDGAWLYFGGYLQSMSMQLQSRGCRRIALLREPVARLLSARAYCAQGGKGNPPEQGGDVLCGSRGSGSVGEWAAHWGSYLFRQLALEPTLYSKLTRKTANRHTHVNTPGPVNACTSSACMNGSVRFTWTEQRQAFGANDDGVSTQPGRTVLRQLVRQMSSGQLFDIVAIYEEWDTSMALLDAVLPLSAGRIWEEQAQLQKDNARSQRRRSAAAREEDERDADRQLVAARSDPNVLSSLAADLRLYAAGFQWFHTLCERNALGGGNLPEATPLAPLPPLPSTNAAPFSESSSPARAYMIFADERTGSTSLCWALDQHPQIKCDHELYKNEIGGRPTSWVCEQLLRYVGLPPPAQQNSACPAVMRNLGAIMDRYWSRCAYGACGGKVFPVNMLGSHRVDEIFRNRFSADVRLVQLVRRDKHAQFVSRSKARASGEWGSTPALRAATGNRGANRGGGPRVRVRVPPSDAAFELFATEQRAWERQVERLNPSHHFLRIYTEELIGGGRLNRTTLNRVAQHLGVGPYSMHAFNAMIAGQSRGQRPSYRRFFKNASGVGT